ncbi:DMT family transporter [Synechococcus sp. UW140]|uniref:DMT family transporter n=1 Tax=Synechococcus sp. UW140 TaxID=368503 RepID=UPI003137C98F
MKSGFALLAIFIILRGSDSTILKALQRAGSITHSSGGAEVISFCNVFFFSSLVCGLAMVLYDKNALVMSLPRLQKNDRLLLMLQSFSGFFLGPVAFFFALYHLTVVQQTLLFSLTLPCTVILANLLLKEQFPRFFAISIFLISIGLFMANYGESSLPMAMANQTAGILWGLLGVISLSFSGILNRITAQRGFGVGLTIGVNSLAAAVAFGIIALLIYGPSHFYYLRIWWVLGVIGAYAITISLGSVFTLMMCYEKLGVITVSFWSSLTILVAIAAASILLAEPLQWQSIVGAVIILVAILAMQFSTKPNLRV